MRIGDSDALVKTPSSGGELPFGDEDFETTKKKTKGKKMALVQKKPPTKKMMVMLASTHPV